MDQERKLPSRRGLLKGAGIGAAIAAGGSGCKTLPNTGKSTAPIHQRPWWVKAVSRPTLGETTTEFERFSGADIFKLYRELKDEREGEGAFKKEQQARRSRVVAWAREGKKGFSLRDRQVAQAAWTVMRSARAGERLLSWNRLRIAPPSELGLEPYRASPEETANTIKAAARLYGAALAGIAPMNEKYVNRRDGDRDIVFEDVAEPKVTEEKFVIPKSMKWVVAIGIQMDLDLINLPGTTIGEGASSLGYSHCAFVVSTLAEFIRGLGYQAIPSVNDTAQSVPFAIDAGLGELSRMNRLITPEFGPAVRLCKVFTDLPMACDKPVGFGVVEFCKRCKKCAYWCPSQALSHDDEPSFKIKGPWNNAGHKAWFEDSYKCYHYWQELTTACSVCFSVCPYTKGDKAWIHDAVKAAASVAPPADHLFRVMDDAFGYGNPSDPEEWWKQDAPAFGIDSRRGTRS